MGFRDQVAQQQFRAADVRFGSKADIAECETNVRFTPNSGHWNSTVKCLLCAKSGLMPRSKNQRFRTDAPNDGASAVIQTPRATLDETTSFIAEIVVRGCSHIVTADVRHVFSDKI